jgi:hypothetical protein
MSQSATIILITVVVMFSIGELLVMFFFIRRKAMAKIEAKDAEDQTVTDTSQMDQMEIVCPQCQVVMKPGYAVGPRGIVFRSQQEPAPGFFTLRPPLPNTANTGVTFKENRAWHCAACKLLLVDHNTLEPRK